MQKILFLSPLLLGLLVLTGCGKGDGTQSASTRPDKVAKNLAELSPEDRALAQKQGYCAVQTDEKLGSMGKPVKVMIKDQPVFLCCESCAKEAKADPDKTLAKVKELQEKTAKEARP